MAMLCSILTSKVLISDNGASDGVAPDVRPHPSVDEPSSLIDGTFNRGLSKMVKAGNVWGGILGVETL